MPLDLVLVGRESLFRGQGPVEAVRGPEAGLVLPAQADLVQLLLEALVVGVKLGLHLLVLGIDRRRNQLPSHFIVPGRRLSLRSGHKRLVLASLTDASHFLRHQVLQRLDAKSVHHLQVPFTLRNRRLQGSVGWCIGAVSTDSPGCVLLQHTRSQVELQRSTRMGNQGLRLAQVLRVLRALWRKRSLDPARLKQARLLLLVVGHLLRAVWASSRKRLAQT